MAGFTECLNNGTRVDDVINFCNCTDRYDGVLCEIDLGMFRLRFVFYVNIMQEHQENTQRPLILRRRHTTFGPSQNM